MLPRVGSYVNSDRILYQRFELFAGVYPDSIAGLNGNNWAKVGTAATYQCERTSSSCARRT